MTEIANEDDAKAVAMWKTLDKAIETLNNCFESDEYERGDLECYIAARLRPETQYQLFLQIMGNAGCCDDPINKHFFLDMATAIGPDWAQHFYRISVFMTKVA